MTFFLCPINKSTYDLHLQNNSALSIFLLVLYIFYSLSFFVLNKILGGKKKNDKRKKNKREEAEEKYKRNKSLFEIIST